MTTLLSPASERRTPLPALSESRALRAWVFFGLYVVEGIPSGFALTAVANYLAYRRVPTDVIGAFAARLAIPWSVQFAWGPLIDRFQGSAMGRRKPWVLGAQLAATVASLGLLAVRDPAAQVGLLSLAFLVHGLFSSIQDASVDAMAISIIPESERGRVNAFMRAGLLLGSGVGAAVWSQLLHRHGFPAAALAQSLALGGMAGLTFFVRERPGDSLLPWGRARGGRDEDGAPPEPKPTRTSLRWVFAELFRGLAAPRAGAIFALCVLVYTALSIFIRAYPNHLIEILGWRDDELSALSGTLGTTVGLATTMVMAMVVDRVGPRRLMAIMMAAIGGFLVAFGALGPFWGSRALASGAMALWFVFDPGFSVACMPVLMSLCRRGVEGSQFTAYMALVNLAGAGGTYLSGLAQRSIPAPTIGIACGLALLAALPLAIRILRGGGATPAAPADQNA